MTSSRRVHALYLIVGVIDFGIGLRARRIQRLLALQKADSCPYLGSMSICRQLLPSEFRSAYVKERMHALRTSEGDFRILRVRPMAPTSMSKTPKVQVR